MKDSEKPSREAKLRLGVSTCLLGELVRFDGGHKLDRSDVQRVTDSNIVPQPN